MTLLSWVPAIQGWLFCHMCVVTLILEISQRFPRLLAFSGSSSFFFFFDFFIRCQQFG